MDETRVLLFVLIALVLYMIFSRPMRRRSWGGEWDGRDWAMKAHGWGHFDKDGYMRF